MEKIAGLHTQNFIEITENDNTYYGGDQEWWESTNPRFHKFGCGVITMCDTELYITAKRDIDKNQYMALIEHRFHRPYHFRIARGVPFWKMSLGFWRVCKKHAIHAFAWWCPTVRKEKLRKRIQEMLVHYLPVPASYFVFLKKNRLPLYRYNDNLKVFTHSQSIRSHYFTITGLYYDESSDTHYLQLSSWGECFYAELEAWIKKRSLFSNILYYRIKQN